MMKTGIPSTFRQTQTVIYKIPSKILNIPIEKPTDPLLKEQKISDIDDLTSIEAERPCYRVPAIKSTDNYCFV